MPIRQWIEKGHRRVRAVVSGDFTTDDIMRAIDAAVQDPDFQPGFDVLSDHSDVGEPLTAVQAREMTVYLGSLSKYMAGSRWAVVTRKPASYGMMRIVSVLAEHIPMRVKVFGSVEEAERWLSSSSVADDSEEE